MTVIRRASAERLTELARGIVRFEFLIVDGAREWQTSLLLMSEELTKVRNLGAILVPVGPHLGGYWLNGKVPGITLSVVMVAKGDLRDLQRRVDAMNAALYPTDLQT